MATKYQSQDHRIIGYLIIQGQMETVSPLRIGSGKADRAEVEVIRLPEGTPYVPAAGFVGALAHRFQEEVDIASLQDAAEVFWGTEMNGAQVQNAGQTWQSHLLVSDMTFDQKNTPVKVRDGVRISYETNTAEEGAKYDYELLEEGYTFTFRGEVPLRAGFRDKLPQIRQLAGFIGECLHNEFAIGGLTTRGFGQLKCRDFQVRHFDFEQAGEDKVWFDYLDGKEGILEDGAAWMEEAKALPRNSRSRFSVSAEFELAGSLLIGAPGGPNDEEEKVQLTSKGDSVISGKSLAGVVRHRSYKILRTMGLDEQAASDKIGDLFGDVDLEGGKRAKKSRVVTHEAKIRKGSSRKRKQTRIRIDRFTGGVIRGGLFDAKPVWRQSGNAVKLRMDIRENAQPWEMALLLHVLRDLWTSDLAIGGEKNIGRGRLQGRTAKVDLNGKYLKLEAGENGTIKLEGDQDAKNTLEAAQNQFMAQFQTEHAL